MTETPDPRPSKEEDDLLFVIAYALRYQGRRRTTDADAFMARAAAERVLNALRRGYEIKPKPPELYRGGVVARPREG